MFVFRMHYAVSGFTVNNARMRGRICKYMECSLNNLIQLNLFFLQNYLRWSERLRKKRFCNIR